MKNFTCLAVVAGLAMLALVASHRAHAAATEASFSAKTTGDLADLCDPKSDSALDNAGVNFCQGFAQGAVTVELSHDAGSRSMKLFCLPDPLPSRNDAMADFVKWARAVPDRLSTPAADGLIRFLGDRYPCGKK
jgi:hypothetical protein